MPTTNILHLVTISLYILHVDQVTQISAIRSGQLGSSCKVDGDCGGIEFSRCYQNTCVCLPYYAAYNSTLCLPSTMLGFECLIHEQCSKKVANSTCIDGICRCEPGLLQFRRHTCLTGAKLGEVCYSDVHCRLSDMDTHCDFMIANVFGRCVCNAPLRQSRSGMCLPNVPPPSTSTLPSLDFPYPAIIKVDNEIKPFLTDGDVAAYFTYQQQQQNYVPFKQSQQQQQLFHKPTPVSFEYSNWQKTKKPINGSTANVANAVSYKYKNKTSTSSSDNKRPANNGGTSKPSKYQNSKPHKKHKPQHYQQEHQQESQQLLFQLSSNSNRPNETIDDKVDKLSSSTINNTNKKSSSSSSKLKIPPVKQSPLDGSTASPSMVGVFNTTPYNKVGPTITEDNFRYSTSSNTQHYLTTTVVRSSTTEVASSSTATSAIQRGADNEEQLEGQRGEEEAVSLGYRCETDRQCMRVDNNSRCIGGTCDCLARRTRLENACSAKNTGCHRSTFQCRSSGQCISWFFVCDGRKDCTDGSDEDCKDRTSCPEYSYRCGTTVPAICISQATRCDGTLDCPNGEDELNCTTTQVDGCPPSTFQCTNGECLPEYEFCNAVITCEDGSDEPKDSCTGGWDAILSTPAFGVNNNDVAITGKRMREYCPFRCRNGRCRSSAVVCSGRDGCGDNSDEDRCTICKCPLIV